MKYQFYGIDCHTKERLYYVFDENGVRQLVQMGMIADFGQ